MSAPSIYFFCCEEPDNYQNDIIPLAEGLRELGVPFHSRCNYWRRSSLEGDFLFKESPAVAPEDCDLLVFPYRWFHWFNMADKQVRSRPMPPEVKVPRSNRRYRTVCLDDNDGYETVSWKPEFRHFDLILRTKYNHRTFNPPNLRPWAIGLHNRFLSATAGAPAFEDRKRVIYSNFNASHPYPHTSRTLAMNELHPRLAGLLDTFQPPHANINEAPADDNERFLWEQTNGRHAQAYYDRLKTSRACSAFCGEIVPAMPRSPQNYFIGGNRARLKVLPYRLLDKIDPRPSRIISWDSFRFWETLAAGTVAFHVDLALHGVSLPVMPENWRHYVGVDFRDIDSAVRRLKASPALLEDISEQGREWAIEHYSPRAVAERFLSWTAGL
jgi:hypothetical protein